MNPNVKHAAFACAEPGPPEMLRVSNVQPQIVNVSWAPPGTRNGLITRYRLNYSNSTHSLSRVLGANQRMTLVEYLNEFTLYRFELSASTIAGFGPPAVENHTTAEAGTDVYPALFIAQ